MNVLDRRIYETVTLFFFLFLFYAFKIFKHSYTQTIHHLIDSLIIIIHQATRLLYFI